MYLHRSLSTWQKRKSSRVGRPERGSERGMAVGEMLVLTLPLCLLSMALISRLSASGTRRLDSLTAANVAAQRTTRGDSACAPKMDLSALPMVGVIASDRSVLKSILIQAPAAAVILPTGDKTEAATSDPSKYAYHFQALASSMAPDPLDRSAITSQATFLCNEPIGDGEEKKLGLGAWVFGVGMWEARKLLGNGGGGGGGEEPQATEMKDPGSASHITGGHSIDEAVDRGREEKQKEEARERQARAADGSE